MSKNLVNPFEEAVVFGKAYPVAVPAQRAVVLRALVPTGKHVGHGQALERYTGKKSGGRKAGVEHYRSKGKRSSVHRAGGFGKAAPSVQNGLRMIQQTPKGTLPTGRGPATSPSPRIQPRPSVKNGLRMVRDMKVNSNIPDGARRGSRLT